MIRLHRRIAVLTAVRTCVNNPHGFNSSLIGFNRSVLELERTFRKLKLFTLKVKEVRMAYRRVIKTRVLRLERLLID